MGASFQAEVRAAMEQQKTRLLNVAKESIVEVCDEVLQGAATPVDKGQFMANMRASIGGQDLTWTQDTDTDGVPTAMKIRQVIDALKLGDVFYLTNSAPYGPMLEYGLYRELQGYPNQTPRTSGGYSTQAPHGVFRVSCEKWKDFVFSAIDKTMNLTEAVALDAPSFSRSIISTSISHGDYVKGFGSTYHPQIMHNQAGRMAKGRK